MELKTFIKQVIEEDLGGGDITTDAIISSDSKTTANIISKQSLVLAGMDVARKVFELLDPACEWKPKKKDGQVLKNGDLIATVEGKTQAILKVERVALNFLQRLSGIATLTREFVDKVEGTGSRILDTRKTTPGLRALEKYAVQMGGANNHRIGLFDRYLIKDNHIAAAGSVSKAVETVLASRKEDLLIEIEVRNFSELKEALKYPIDIILLDNFSPSQVKEALTLKKGKIRFEASGRINLNNVLDYAKTGVDFISVGSLTHSAPAVDLSLIISSI